MSDLYLHEITENIVKSVVNNLPQSLLITGPSGVGSTTLAYEIANRLSIKPTALLPEKDGKINLEQGIINVEIMRQLTSETDTKSNSKRIIIIDKAETMTTQAQNAFLKLLEEPNEYLHFILVSNRTSKLLPTIRSRVESIVVKPINIVQTKNMIKKMGVNDDVKIGQLVFMSNGLPAELTKLVNDDEYFNYRTTIVKEARTYLTDTLYKKLMVINKYKDDRHLALLLLNDAANILEKSLSANPKVEIIKLSNKLIRAIEKVESNGNIRLCLSQAIL